ncbi:MAG: TetR family transcriptional regulator [Acidobacteria bacterium]|jgi:TetR/AcrR family fatty acid metabolism transcriptional regulator|nr:MAG: TetR family transcriptional regulator [Acidobacteriota bacterium]
MNTHSVRREKNNEKYQAILRAAIKVFASRGFFQSKVADVAQAAGVADGTVYLYFKSKDDLLISIFNETMDDVIAKSRGELQKIEDPVERLRKIASLHLAWLGQDRQLAVVFQVELRQSTKFMEEFSTTRLAEYFELIREVIVDGQAKGIFRKEVQPQVATKVFFGALDEMVTNWILSRKRYALETMVRPVLDILIRGLAT